MSLDSLVSAIADTLTQLPNGCTVLLEPPAMLPEERQFIVFESPGDSRLTAHGGKKPGSVVYANADSVIIWYQRKLQRDAADAGARETRVLLDDTRALLWGTFGKNRFDGHAAALTPIRTLGYGPDQWGSDFTFGFILSLDCEHWAETVPARGI